MTQHITVALVGNPNSGKTTIYNALTGAREHVGNYSGVTVDQKSATVKKGNYEITFIDLPGTYSLTARTLDEQVTRRYIIRDKPDLVLDIIDYSNLERHLYLTTQLIELEVPLLLVFNMSDMASKQGIKYDLERFSQKLKTPIVLTTGSTGQGLDSLLDAIISRFESSNKLPQPSINYGRDINNEINKLLRDFTDLGEIPAGLNPRWFLLKLLERDDHILEHVNSQAALDLLARSHQRLESIYGESPEIYIADRRYGFVSGICKKTVISSPKHRLRTSDKIDRILTNRLLGIPIFLFLMFLIFNLTFTLGSHPMTWLEHGFSWLSAAVSGFWAPGSESLLRSLLVEGIIAGVGGVIVFLPNIMFLFLGISLLEDSGYMPRAAFIMDRLMQKLGLQGKSFIPMLIGFGCSVPAILATRTIESRRDRLTTMLVIPLMSCGARLPIYALIIPAFFPVRFHSTMLFVMYLIGIVLAILLSRLLRFSILKGPTLPLIMELPPYRLPTWNSILTHMWHKSWLYLRKAGTVILGFSVLLWLLTTFPQKEHLSSLTPEAIQAEQLSYSVAGRIGHAIEPVIKPLGFDWRIGTAMIGAFSAKELFVAQLGIVYKVGEVDEQSETLRAKLQRFYNPLTGFTVMLFMLIGMPCMATIAVTRQESGSWGWALLQMGGLTGLAWVSCLIVYQVGSLIGIGL